MSLSHTQKDSESKLLQFETCIYSFLKACIQSRIKHHELCLSMSVSTYDFQTFVILIWSFFWLCFMLRFEYFLLSFNNIFFKLQNLILWIRRVYKHTSSIIKKKKHNIYKTWYNNLYKMELCQSMLRFRYQKNYFLK